MTINTFEDVLKAAAGEPRLHPNGFIQLDLDYAGVYRLHVWPAEPLPAQKTRHTIHNHTFNFDSTVIRGQLHNLRYEFDPYINGNYAMYDVKRIGGEETILQFSGVRGDLIRTGIDIVAPNFKDDSPRQQRVWYGNSYFVRAFDYHDTITFGATVTIMKKVKLFGGAPGVLVPAHVLPDNDFRRSNISTDRLWDEIRKALK